MSAHLIRRSLAAAAVAVVIITGAVACEDDASLSSDKGSPDSGKSEPAAPEKSLVEEFKAYAEKNGSAQEKSAVAHVTKVQGADEQNDIMDSAEVHTNLKGDMMDTAATGSAKLIASSFADFQASRDRSSENGLVTVYNASGDMLGNGKF